MIQETNKGVLLDIKVRAGSCKTLIKSFEHDVIKIDIKAIPEKGKANEELLRFLKKFFNTTDISLIVGKTSCLKKVLIAHISKEEVLAKLLLAL